MSQYMFYHLLPMHLGSGWDRKEETEPETEFGQSGFSSLYYPILNISLIFQLQSFQNQSIVLVLTRPYGNLVSPVFRPEFLKANLFHLTRIQVMFPAP